eukprot:TRINITY_DN9123_c1_g3_i1.p1 TRINITY_DN9123_c1_g3~~TRINITY_DN9123_c1_g3_i1.p1  ORF type:complete len:540 (-),score=50.02 TRINITY_DN9123_c1_g3_i1:121-1644(-)
MMTIACVSLLFIRPCDMYRQQKLQQSFGQSILSFTFNAGNDEYVKKVAAALDEPFKSSSESGLAFVCLQEAPVPVMSFTEDSTLVDAINDMQNKRNGTKWEHITTAFHRGKTDTTTVKVNAQVLSIWFQPPKGMKVKRMAGENAQCATLQNKHTNEKIEICALTSYARNSIPGKGAVTGVVEVREKGKRTCFSLSVACAHLSSKNDMERKRDAEHIDQWLRHAERPVAKNEVGNVCPDTNAFLILGDLNYRLRQSHLDAQWKEMRKEGSFTTDNMLEAIDKRIEHGAYPPDRDIFQAVDRLREGIPGTDDYTCNSIAFQPPTYKADTTILAEDDEETEDKEGEEKTKQKEEACKMLIKEAARTQGSDYDLRDLIGLCYAGIDFKDHAKSKWPVSKASDEDLLQLGWLDRVCWKVLPGYIVEEDTHFSSKAWHFVAETMSDHMPTFSKLTFRKKDKFGVATAPHSQRGERRETLSRSSSSHHHSRPSSTSSSTKSSQGTATMPHFSKK